MYRRGYLLSVVLVLQPTKGSPPAYSSLLKIENRGQKKEDRGQRAEDGGRKAENRIFS
jgi:hypothetical protein